MTVEPLSSSVAKPLTPRQRAWPKEVRAKAQALYAQGLPPTRISTLTTVPAVTIGQWAIRGGWKLARDEAIGMTSKMVGIAVHRVNMDGGKETRGDLSEVVKRSAKVLRESKIDKVGDVERVAPLVRELTSSAKVLHEWDSQKEASLVMIGAYHGEVQDAEDSREGDSDSATESTVDAQRMLSSRSGDDAGQVIDAELVPPGHPADGATDLPDVGL